MARVVLQEIVAGFGSTDALNNNFAALAEALNVLLSRVGDNPNQMEADLDLNGHVLLNSGESDDPNRVVTFQEVTNLVAAESSGIVVQEQEIQTSLSSQTVFTLANIAYVPGANNLAVYVNGVRKFAPTDYVETSPNTVTFLAGQTVGAKVQFVTNEYLATVTVTDHTHPWSQITNVPIYTTRWPVWTEVTDKPATFPPASHTHAANDIISGRLADQHRGVFVQAPQPSIAFVGDIWAF